MLVTARVGEALDRRRDALVEAARQAADLEDQYRLALDEAERLGTAGLEARLEGEPWPGARPMADMERTGLIQRFHVRWATAEEARAWALDTLRGVTTVAVDGSQIPASKEFGVPVSLAQVAWFVNPHEPDLPYIKDVRNEVVTAGEVEEYAFAESRLNQVRFALEMGTAREQVEGLPQSALVLVDGSFVLSFVGRMAPPGRAAYLRPLFEALDASERRAVPAAGYVDLSYASDLVTMLQVALDLPRGALFDARLLAARMEPFDCTAPFVCARGDVLPHYQMSGRDRSKDLCFVYLQVGWNRLPARIDLPRWVAEEPAVLARVLDLVRAEIVVGSGYPYALETADAAAVLTAEDRMQFFRLFHDFAHDAGLDVRVPRKSVSKAHRR